MEFDNTFVFSKKGNEKICIFLFEKILSILSSPGKKLAIFFSSM